MQINLKWNKDLYILLYILSQNLGISDFRNPAKTSLDLVLQYKYYKVVTANFEK